MTPEDIADLYNQSRHPDEEMKYVKTGSFWLDEALGIGGWPVGRISELYGEPGVGTSTLAYHSLAEATKRGPCLYLDHGNSFNQFYAKRLGVSLDQLIVAADLSVMRHLRDKLELIVIDGPPVPPGLIPLEQTVVFVGEGYSILGSDSSVKVRMRGNGIWGGGHSVTVEVVENAYAPPPEDKGYLGLHYGKGFIRAEEVITLAMERNVVYRRGHNYYTAHGVKLGYGWADTVQNCGPATLAHLESTLRHPAIARRHSTE